MAWKLKDDSFDSIYKSDEYIHFIYQRTGEFKEVNTKGNTTRMHPVLDYIEVPFDTIENMNLNNRGESEPFTHDNVINYSRYVAYYWLPFLEPTGCFLLMLLHEYADTKNGKDIIWEKPEELAKRMGKSKKTIMKYLKILEEHNFIIVIHRLNKLNGNKESNPIIKLRRTVPLLSKELEDQLCPKMKLKHKQYMETFGKYSKQDIFSFEAKETKDELLTKGDKILSKKARERIESVFEEDWAIDYISEKLANTGYFKRYKLHRKLEEVGMSKPTRELLFENALSVYNPKNNTVNMIVKEEVVNFLKTEGFSMNKEKVSQAVSELYEIDSVNLHYYSFKEYLYKIEKGKA